MPQFANWNGKIVSEENIRISPDNRSFRYGDGCFETIKVVNGQILLKHLHFQRLFSSLQVLQFSLPGFLTAQYLSDQIGELILANQHEKLARVRLVVHRGDGGLYDVEDNTPHFIIQSWAGNSESTVFNENGLVAGFFPDAVKTADRFSSVKSNNYLGYVMGAIWAKQNKLDDVFLHNAQNRIADTTIANVFIISDGIIKTPSLAEGCVSGVMRRYLITCFQNEGLPYQEAEITPEELLNASEVFLTNANYGVRWVKKVGNSNYGNLTSSLLHKKFIVPLFYPATI